MNASGDDEDISEPEVPEVVFFFCGTVDGWNPANQLSLVVFPII